MVSNVTKTLGALGYIGCGSFGEMRSECSMYRHDVFHKHSAACTGTSSNVYRGSVTITSPRTNGARVSINLSWCRRKNATL